MNLRTLMARFSRWVRRSQQRRGKALGLALLGACAAGSRGADSQEQSDRIKISLKADDIEYSDDQRSAVLTGNVRLEARNLPGRIPELDVTSGTVTVSLKAGDIDASGQTLLTAPGLELTGDDVHYNLRTHDFSVANARTTITVPFEHNDLTLYAKAERIEARDGEVTMRRARITTCDRARPHYAIDVRKTVVAPDRNRLTLRGGTLSLYGTKLFFVPRLNQSLSDPGYTGKLDIELPGYSGAEGLYVPVNRRFTPPEEPVQALLSVRVTQHQFITGHFGLSHERPGLRSWGNVVRHRRMEDDVTKRLLYDALPEAGVEVSRDRGASRFTASLFGGYYREQNVTSGARAADGAATVKLGWDWRPERDRDEVGLFAGVGARASAYGSGGCYRTLDFHVGGSRPLWPGARGSLVLRHHLIGGVTPFEFDDIDLKTEAQGEIATPLVGNWSLSLGGRYDVDRSLLRDYEAGLHFRHHCLTWTLDYRKASGRVGIGVNLTELMDFGRPAVKRRPRQTAPIDALAAQPLERQGLGRLPSLALAPVEPLAATPTEYLSGAAHRQRAPDAAATIGFRPPPSLRLASAAVLQ